MGTLQMLPLLPLSLPETKETTVFQFLLGAEDAEMQEIEKVLKKHNQEFAYAMGGGMRVTPGNAYAADPVVIKQGCTLVLIECEPKSFSVEEKVKNFDRTPSTQAKIRIIDHHRPGDPGFQLAPRYFWEASSLGQLCNLLGENYPSLRQLVIAARDHSRFQAAKGKCPGLHPKIVEEVGRDIIAEEVGVDRKELDLSIKLWKKTIARSERILIGKERVVNLLGASIEKIYSLEHLSVYEACAELKCAVVIKTRNAPGLPYKIVLLGHLSPTTVREFMDTWAKANGLRDVYGCDVRGYAGGYIDLPEAAVAA